MTKAKQYAADTYSSARAWRDAVLARDDNRCVVCGDRRNDRYQAAHHVIFKSHCGEEYRLDPRNGVTLCGDWTPNHCHRALHDGHVKLTPAMLPLSVLECLAEQGLRWIDGEPYGPCASYFGPSGEWRKA